MEYSINKLTKISGVSTRTLRYYDEIGLLKPAKIASSRYRIYEQLQVDMLQQILFYRELGFSLENIKNLLSAPSFDREQAFNDHLIALQNKKERIDKLIINVTKSISVMKGDITMSDKEKFEGFKQKLIDDNEKKYGAEIRKNYGDKIIDESNARLQGLTGEQYEKAESLRLKLEQTLKSAFDVGDPAGELAQKACDLHRQWLCIYYPQYSKEYHVGLSEMYTSDERFKAHYNKITPGCAEFFKNAINIYCSE
jgi:DNA-binding transcriptional MerR regulator